MWELDCEEGWTPKNWRFWTVVLEKTLESPSDCKEIQPVHSDGDQPWGFFGRNDAKAETPVLWPPHAKSWLIGKDPDAGRDWQEEKGMTEDEMAGWHHGLDWCESEWTPGVGDGQGGLACCDSWGRKELDMTEWLNCRQETLRRYGMVLIVNKRVWHDWATELIDWLNWLQQTIKSVICDLSILLFSELQRYMFKISYSPRYSTCIICIAHMKVRKWKWNRSVVSDSLRPHGL